MALVPINVEETALSGLPALAEALATLPPASPITVMIHGFGFRPADPRHCPHRHILAQVPEPRCRKAVSWPRHLGIGPGHLGIALGWQSAGSLWQAWREAEQAGLALARLLAMLDAGGRQANIVAHSLGARVALGAIAHAPEGAVGRVILLHPAEFQAAASRAMASPAGETARVVNVTSHENLLFDAAVEWLIAPHLPGARTLGHGLRRPLPNWTELRIGEALTLAVLARLGHPVAQSSRRVCHWSGYLRPGLFPLYRALLEGSLPIAGLRDALAERRPAPRSRFFEPFVGTLLLPYRRKAPF